jgi:dCTP diphosphatase
MKNIQKKVDEFCKERGWLTDGPNELITSTMIELGELAEHYQWQKEFKELDETKKREIGYEFVDVIVYLCRIANRSGIDIQDMFDEKLPKLAKKYPVGGDPKKAHEEYRKNGKNKLYE